MPSGGVVRSGLWRTFAQSFPSRQQRHTFFFFFYDVTVLAPRAVYGAVSAAVAAAALVFVLASVPMYIRYILVPTADHRCAVEEARPRHHGADEERDKYRPADALRARARGHTGLWQVHLLQGALQARALGCSPHR
jgi:hypothetical protein